MAENSEISWTTHTANFWTGCVKVSDPGLCTNCYALSITNRFGGDFERDRTMVKKVWNDIPRWQKLSEQTGVRPRVFVMSMGDFFEALPETHKDYYELCEARRRAVVLMEETTGIDYLVLTKRISNVKKMVPARWLQSWPSHVRLGISVGTQPDADRDIPRLLQIPCPNFVSMEPLLECVSIRNFLHIAWQCSGCQSYFSGRYQKVCPTCGREDYWTGSHRFNRGMQQVGPGLQWAITGGESGPQARPSHPDWFRLLRDECLQAETPFHLKQWGEWIGGKFDRAKGKMVCQSSQEDQPVGRIFWTNPGEPKVHLWDAADRYWTHASARVGKHAAGRLLDGQLWDQFPCVPAIASVPAEAAR